MKKVFSFVAVAAAMLVAGTASAQLSVNAGYLSSTAKVHTETTALGVTKTNDTSAVLGSGFYAGGSYNVELIGGLGFAPGIYFDMITKKEESNVAGVTSTTNSTLMDINVPLLLNYKLTFGDDFAIFAFAGPDVVFGLSAKSKTVIKSPLGETKTEADAYKKEGNANKPAMTRFDLGLMFGAGVQFSSMRFEIGYELGLLNRLGEKETSAAGVTWKGTEKFNRFFVGVGYTF